METTRLGGSLGASQPGLRRTALGVPAAAAIGVAIMAPAAALAFNPQVVAASIGIALPFCYLVATIAEVCIGYTMAVFTRKFSSAGSLYTFDRLEAAAK